MPNVRKISVPLEDDKYWESERKALEKILAKELTKITLKGTLQGYRQLDAKAKKELASSGVSLSIEAKKWAKQYAKTLSKQLNETTYTYVQKIAQAWKESQAPPEAFEEALTVLYGATRAATIGITETTVAIQAGKAVTWEAAKIKKFRWLTEEDELVCTLCGPKHKQVYQLGSKTPPAHPRCRCETEPV